LDVTLNEYIDRRELLRTPEERIRLVEEIPEVIPDTGDTEVVVDGSMDLHGANQGLSYLMLPSKISSEIFFCNFRERQRQSIVFVPKPSITD